LAPNKAAFAQIGGAQVGTGQIDAVLGDITTPRIPLRDTFFELLDVLLVGHGVPRSLEVCHCAGERRRDQSGRVPRRAVTINNCSTAPS
jgi:hypothetical protein